MVYLSSGYAYGFACMQVLPADLVAQLTELQRLYREELDLDAEDVNELIQRDVLLVDTLANPVKSIAAVKELHR
jgi:hypothetical protein